MDDTAAMQLAMDEARRAMSHGDVPVGAVVVRDGEVIAAAHNERELRNDPTAHAEIIALRAAAKHLGSWRLTDCTMYVTLEPCTMCAGAIINARVGTVVFGAADLKAGALGSLYNFAADPRLNHAPLIRHSVLAHEASISFARTHNPSVATVPSRRLPRSPERRLIGAPPPTRRTKATTCSTSRSRAP
ncbi:MAG: nucleoside deaminase [Actinobacteria bacterium]|nr:nucleoside deaminase [Actinomycetota bacterium]